MWEGHGKFGAKIFMRKLGHNHTMITLKYT